MLQKKLNLKGLRKRVLKLEYENKLISPKPSNKGLPLDVRESMLDVKHTSSDRLNYRILILRNVPIEDAILKQCLTEIATYEDTVNSSGLKGQTKIVSKCIKKNILKKIFLENQVQDDRWLQCKFMYWVTSEASSLKDQLIQLNHLKACIRAEPKDAFLGCLLESGSLVGQKQSIKYKYYYPAEILGLCDLIDKTSASNKATGLEVLGQLLQTIESSVNSMSFVLALKTKKDELALSDLDSKTK